MSANRSRPLAAVVGIAAVVAPILHSATDAMEWLHGGFSDVQLWLNYVAFSPMSWLLLGIYAVHKSELGWMGLVGALLYGCAFTYFSYTTLVALFEQVATYEALWQKVGSIYTVHGAFMVAGGLLFARAALHARELPRAAVWLFAAGLLLNLLLVVVSAPDMLQTVGTVVRNAGLVGMGYAILSSLQRREA